MLNIAEENLHCHHLLFIRDVVNSKHYTDQNCFEVIDTGLVYRKAKLNGVLVAQEQKEEEHHLWLDDGTAVIKAILPSYLYSRKCYKKLEISCSVTVIGKIEKINNEIIIYCAGFQVHEQGLDEIYHLLKVIQERPKKTAITSSSTPMFYTLSSNPSPKRLNFQSPTRPDEFTWSPTHTVATSTPLRASIIRQIEADTEDEFEFSDLGEIDLAALEANAIEQKLNQPMKRKFDIF
ncbi:hypothetical protein G6F70_002885 [Rhizopus microsporus]|uniref:CST complex subunit Stn1 N-terminal domain-containing protein n=2 Tax=Rhizopus TaxID=4842 RepID=A0A367J7Z3_RHIAZ|nr:hypothetical protein G6F71_001623 [Rhizopus microsporus]RCH85949.1 hypothetical protein CU097_006134 [Rhizopus azygosporus]KAG1201736.1 hypothetical protein G6F70_002885 [Rhizopus microsporus]KAG1213337.1 hypothetical protein G6F69_002898 [Rhizopus microsporus]KAG1235875.1 hypothetical protein G6F67_002423 [Rhizopus microsporus]